MGLEGGGAYLFVLAVDALLGDVLGQAVNEVAVVVKQRRGDHQLVGAVAFGEERALQAVLALGDALAVVEVPVPVEVGEDPVDDVHGSSPLRHAGRQRATSHSTRGLPIRHLPGQASAESDKR